MHASVMVNNSYGGVLICILWNQQEINSELSDSPLRLQYFIVITGVTYFVLAFFIPTMSKMRFWLGPSTIVTFSYIVILLVVLVKDGMHKKFLCNISLYLAIWCSLLYIVLLKGKLRLQSEIMKSMGTKQTEYSMPSMQFHLVAEWNIYGSIVRCEDENSKSNFP